ncbi:pseudouridine synthase [Aquamicrobium sp. LC103]|uniref:pseudouridine synthase n=1 Tax=Aquamicrobium sp. LC103 TaxID=1120658 RepID=UPI00063EA72D|nr:pseudouridine synthase [Aquamicrobium sp. LC103]TKT69181.1 pseudouridine synthase [Aquamicrobium sp. LC103]
MNDERKRPARGGAGKDNRRGEARDGSKKPGFRADGPSRADKGKKPFAKRRDDAGEARSERKPFRKRDDERKPFRAREEGDRPFRERGEGDRPFRKRDGEGKPFRSREEGAKPYRKREEGGSARGERPGRAEREQFRAGAGDRPRAKPFKPREEAAEAGEGERIAKRLARAGVASRRDAEEMIAAGRVSVNGKVLESPALNVTARDRIELDGKEIPPIERTRLFLLHKPGGVVTTSRDPEGRKTVFDILPANLPRLMTVGRLDINTEGLLLLTNDGGLARVLELPATGWLRRYRVRVHGKVDEVALAGLKDGIAVDGVFYGSIEASLDREQGSNAWLTIGLREGKNREVKNILGALGLDVTRLIRVSFGPFQLGELAEGEVRELKGRLLRDQLGDRLIEESGANFDAPILNEFSNKPVSRPRDAAREEERGGQSKEFRPNRKREREEKRENALDRLQTRPSRGGKPFGPGAKPGKREEKPFEQPRSRTSNVWMAPGAKPMGEKKKAAATERNKDRRYAGKPRPTGPRKPRGER